MDLGLATAATIHQHGVEIRDAIVIVVAQRVRELAVAGVAERSGDMQGEILVTAGAREDVDLGATGAGGGVRDCNEVSTPRLVADLELPCAGIGYGSERRCGVEDPRAVVAQLTQCMDLDGPTAGVVEGNSVKVGAVVPSDTT